MQWSTPRRPNRRIRPTCWRLEDRTVPTTFTVSSLLDNGAGTLRAQIAAANGNAGDDTINFSVTGLINLTTGELAINDGVVISGPGITVSGNNNSRVFNTSGAPAGEKITLVAMTIVNGKSAGSGGGILAGDEALSVIACTLAGNHAT